MVGINGKNKQFKGQEMKVTLQQIKDQLPCKDGWEKLLKAKNGQGMDVEFPIVDIIDSNGIKHAIWALRALEGKGREIRLFACDCAENILGIFETKHHSEKRPREAIDMARKYANGQCTKVELYAAYSAASAVNYSVSNAYSAAAYSAAAYSAAYSAATAATYSATYSAATAAYIAANYSAAAYSAAVAATYSAIYSAATAAYIAANYSAAAFSAERERQIDLFKKYFS